MNRGLIYFDNAATGYPKPDCVKRAVLRAFGDCAGNPGRSGHILSLNSAKAVYECREKVCKLLNFRYPERVVFTVNATYALNMAIKGLAVNDSHIIISNLEHNSVYRPIYSLSKNKENNIDFSVFDASQIEDKKILDSFKNSIKPNTKMAVITAASNICGKITPLSEISKICKANGITLIVDASQALGEIHFDMESIAPCVVCSAGHKGLYGPTGTGFAVFSKEIMPSPIIYGGNGIMSESPEMGEELPEMLEAGTLNTTGILGLSAGIDYITNYGIDDIRCKCSAIEHYITDNLKEMGGVVYGNFKNKTPIILFNLPGIDAVRVSSSLDAEGICTRSGLHCAPLAHKALGTGKNGAVRASLGYANTFSEAKHFVDTVYKILKSRI